MAFIKYETNKKGVLQAKIQVSGKNLATGKNKIYSKRIYNDNNLTDAKFRKYAERQALDFEIEIEDAIENQTVCRTRILSFPELMKEWKENVKANLSHNYYLRAGDVEKKFNEYLQRKGLYNKPINELNVRDIQLFLNEYMEIKETKTPYYRIKKELPVKLNVRLDKHRDKLTLKTAKSICEKYDLYFDKYFEQISTTFQYSKVTIKGYRRILRTVFNEAVRYEWIIKNPVCFTKVTTNGNNMLINPVTEKQVFSIKESQIFLDSLEKQKELYIHRVIPIKIMLLAGLRNGEIHGLKWSDIDLDKKTISVERERLYSSEKGCYIAKPKTLTSTRIVPIPDYLVNELQEYKNWFRMVDDNFDNKLDQYYIAVNMYREPINPTSLDKWLTDFEHKTGQKHVTCHGLRHTYCSLLLTQNVPIQTVSKYMGHADSTITLKVYSHFIPDTQTIAVQALNDIVNNKGEK